MGTWFVNVVLPEPFGPAMTMSLGLNTFFTVGEKGGLCGINFLAQA